MKTFQEVLSDLRNGFQASNPDTNPFLLTGFLKSILDTMAGRFTDLFRKSDITRDQFYVTTCDDDIVTFQGEQYGVSPTAAEEANGFIIAQGVVSTSIPASTQLVSSTGLLFETLSASTILAENVSISSITRVGTTATVTTATEHQIVTGSSITISGADQAGYNLATTVTVVDSVTFTYEVDSATVTPATGTIIFSVNRAIIEVEALETGEAGNLAANEQIDFVVTITDVNSIAGVIFNGFTGGRDIETVTAYRQKILSFIREPVAPFNEFNIERTIRDAVTTATRIRVYSITPNPGEVTIYFVEDGKSNILPTSQILQEAKDSLEAIRPAEVDPASIFVLAPTLVSNDFTFASISPDTNTMQEAITANLEFYYRNLEIGQDIVKVEYDSIITNTIDTTTGASLESFTLSVEPGDTARSDNELGTLGNVTF